MYYPEELVEEVRTRNDIVDVVGQYVRLTKRGSTYFGLCPFHNEKTGSFSVTPGKQMYYCFGCHAGGNVITFLMEYENYTFPEALKVLAERAGIVLPQREATKEERREADLRSRLLEINKEAGKYFYYQMRRDREQKAYRYLTGRGLSDETIRRFGLGFSNPYENDLYLYLRKKGYHDDILKETGLVKIEERGAHDKFWNRVMFPIMDVNSRIIGFGGRVMGQGEPKYLNSPETRIFDKGRNLYGLNVARSSREPNILICEGYMDTIALHQAGFTNAAACLGTAMTQGQASLLKRYTSQIILTYDSDAAGTKAALRAIPILKEAGMTVKVLNLKPYKDPDEFIKNLGADAFRERIGEATGSFQFEIAQIYARYDMKDPESKTDFHRAVAGRLCGFSSELERSNYMESVCEEYHIPLTSMKQMVIEEARRTGVSGSQTPGVRPVREKKKEKESPIRISQKLLLTWLIESPELYHKIAEIITPKDFTDELCSRVAGMVWEQLESGLLNPAGIVNYFINDADEYKEVAALFNTKLRGGMTKEEQEKAFAETVLRVKKHSLDEAGRRAADVESLQEIIKQQAALKDLHISFD
ncbi:MAG: DNA primase [Lachnospiraceae bacterium]|jgi:DNA primase|nr:DNA primase [Lachnospiraceae bacterium]